jgi:hypothetical protein
MKFLILLPLIATLSFSQETKPSPKSDKAPTERSLSKEEVWHLKDTIAEINLINQKYKIEEYHKELDPLVADQQATIQAACESIGIPKEKVQSECGVNLGLGPDGKPLNGPDGKTPVTPRVFWNKPAPVTPEKK